MATIVIQQGHVARTTGATGTHREQELARRLALAMQPLLVQRGHSVRVIGADDPIPASDVFVALHGDGSSDRSRRGASVGYRDEPGRKLAAAWKRRHQLAGYDGGFLPDNYTTNLRDYYGVSRSTARHRFIAEHGHLTNPTDEVRLFGNIDAFARAHVDAIGDVVGHPAPQGVKPMFDPPHRLLPVVASLNYPGGGALLLAENGALYAYGCPNNGAPDGKQYFAGRKAARLEYNPRWEEAGRPEPHKGLPWYIVIATSGEPYGHGGF